MTRVIPLDEAVDKLIAAKQNKMSPLMELAQLLFVGVDFERAFVAGLASKHGGYLLARSMLLVYHRHRALSVDGTGLKDWSTALAKELNGKLEETTEPKPKRSLARTVAIETLMGHWFKYRLEEVEKLVDEAKADDPGDIVQGVLKQLGAERKAS